MKHPRTPVSMADPNVDEIRAIRAELSARFDNDVGKLCKHLRRVEARYRDRVVQPGSLTCKSPQHVGSGEG